MKELREHHEGKRMYPINPYVEVYKLCDNLYGLFAENCDGMGDYWMYLTIGPEKAFLIDTGYGLGDLKGLVDEITGGMEVIVVNTHDHYDHAYGNCYFDKVYCHEYLVPYLESQNPHMWDYLFDAWGDNIWLEFDRNDLPEYKSYEIIGVPDGYTWDLGGGYEVELIFTGGHAAGHAAYLDKAKKRLFTGDNICSDVGGCGTLSLPDSDAPHIETTLLTNYRERLKLIADRIDEYDYVFPQHMMNNVENSVILNVLEAVDAVIADPECYSYKVETYGKQRGTKSTRYFKQVMGFGVIAYTM